MMAVEYEHEDVLAMLAANKKIQLDITDTEGSAEIAYSTLIM